ncbi:hypothetical protein D5281_11970 [bacterium 1xD42-62]|uniref:Uncharacterized protein n=1 Tax=Parablautia muri TaxID=2320879 RepID=A0A9X5BGD2_9FIRM|nr:hypothetical protein [Parablautia muri]
MNHSNVIQYYDTGEYSCEIYKTADAKTMRECWLGFHTFDVEMAIADLKELYEQKCNERKHFR